jgi:hypothetical protein
MFFHVYSNIEFFFNYLVIRPNRFLKPVRSLVEKSYYVFKGSKKFILNSLPLPINSFYILFILKQLGVATFMQKYRIIEIRFKDCEMRIKYCEKPFNHCEM